MEAKCFKMHLRSSKKASGIWYDQRSKTKAEAKPPSFLYFI